MSPLLALAALLGTLQPAEIEPQPLPEAVADTGINVLFDSSHQFSFYHHWSVQDAIRDQGHRVTGNQATLTLPLVPGVPVRVRDQKTHEVGSFRPFTFVPAPAFDVLYTYQGSEAQPYLDAEQAAIRAFVEAGGGLIADGGSPRSPLGRMLRDYGVTLPDRRAPVAAMAGQPLASLGTGDDPFDARVAEYSDEWTVLVGGSEHVGALAMRTLGAGRVIHAADLRVLQVLDDQKRPQPNDALLAELVTLAAGGPKERDDERRVPWEGGGIGGAIYPEKEMQVGSVRVVYAENQLPQIIELPEKRFPELFALLQHYLPTPPNPGGDYYLDLAAGDGGGWAENIYTPKLSGTISLDTNGILSVLAHELTHTMYGPAAVDGTLGVEMPGFFSEAHAGWFQRKIGRDLGFDSWPFWDTARLRANPALAGADLRQSGGPQWEKAWYIWGALDARYGERWYPRWLEHVHESYGGKGLRFSVDDYIRSISETVGEDVAPLFAELGTPLAEEPKAKKP